MRRLFFAALLFAPAAPAVADAPKQRKVDYAREVRPILARCLQCHGPDDKARKGKLRLDTRTGAIAAAVVPGKPEQSELIARVVHEDKSMLMPPPKAGKALTAEEVATLRAWVAQGADYPAHWAYVKPARPAVPEVKAAAWPRNPLDRFVLARLEAEGLRPTAEADRAALLRRAALDLTGLPPSPEEAERFLADVAPGAYERAVDRLLASPGYGERWAASWLDLARYADSQGYANDPDRTIWRYRDWVVAALNANLPYDRFTVEQLAGDLLPNATTEQLVATGFHRNTLVNTEGGTNPEEFRTAAVVDRVNTTMQVWMGTTMACAQCHSHKYDPFTQVEYFRLYAILNNTEDRNSGDDFPTLRVSRYGAEGVVAAVEKEADAARAKLDAEHKKADERQPAWEKSADPKALPKDVAAALAVPEKVRNASQKDKLRKHHRSLDKTLAPLDADVKRLDARLKSMATTTPVLREGKPRETFVLLRGNFLDKGEKVTPGLPSALHGTAEKKLDRMALARWIVSEDNPLTARVAVNRLWEEVFGTGLVETSEEFGLQGDLPSHPELLDFLATEYVRSGWDTKRMLRLLVTSATYRQGSQVSDVLAKRDPFNRLLGRGPRLRLSAEAIRDQALFVGGLLAPRMFGPPVQPARPSFGLSAAFGSSTDWQTSVGEDRYRKGLYTRWRRNAPYPSATTFDAPERTTCNVRRIRTNTPLQALVTLNDPVFVEAAQGLARRVAGREGTPREKVDHAFRLCLTRAPREAEAARLVALYQAAKKQLAQTPAKATDLATVPLGPTTLDHVELAAWTVVGNVLLNLDETLARR